MGRPVQCKDVPRMSYACFSESALPFVGAFRRKTSRRTQHRMLESQPALVQSTVFSSVVSEASFQNLASVL